MRKSLKKSTGKKEQKKLWGVTSAVKRSKSLERYEILFIFKHSRLQSRNWYFSTYDVVSSRNKKNSHGRMIKFFTVSSTAIKIQNPRSTLHCRSLSNIIIIKYNYYIYTDPSIGFLSLWGLLLFLLEYILSHTNWILQTWKNSLIIDYKYYSQILLENNNIEEKLDNNLSQWIFKIVFLNM